MTANEAKAGAGVSLWGNTTLTVTASEVTKNQASEEGAGFYLAQDSICDISSSTFGSNSALSGGVICCEGCNVRINNTVFNTNLAGEFGGAIYALSNSHVGASKGSYRLSFQELCCTKARPHRPIVVRLAVCHKPCLVGRLVT